MTGIENTNIENTNIENTLREKIYSHIWREEAEKDDPFTAQTCYLAGYDVYGDLLGKIQWTDYIYVLFKQDPPSKDISKCLNDLAVAIAANGPRDLSTQAATSAAAGGSTLASCLIAALSVGAGKLGGAREVHDAILVWETCSTNLKEWKHFLTQTWPVTSHSIWPDSEHPFGFDPHGMNCSTPIKQTLAHLAEISDPNSKLRWLNNNRKALEEYAGMPLSMSGVASCAFSDMGFDSQEGEMLYLLLRLPGAAAFSLEQHYRGWEDYPFHKNGLKLTHDPGPE